MSIVLFEAMAYSLSRKCRMSKKSDVSPRKQPTQERARTTVEAVLAAAAQILETTGFDKTTTNKIAEKAGISIGSLYQYFPNKESLASAMSEAIVKKHASRVEKKISDLRGQSIDSLLGALITEVVSLYLGNIKMLRIIAKLLPRVNLIPYVVETRKRIVQLIAGELLSRKDEIRLIDTQLASYVIVNAVMGVFMMIMSDESTNFDQGELTAEILHMTKKYLER